MGNSKSKMPDFKEFAGMLGKLFTDVKKSVVEITAAYKEKHKETEEKVSETVKAKPQKETPEGPNVEEPKDTKTEEPPKSE